MVAAFQAPIILMSQNRQAMRDRLAAGLDYEVNLKAEIEIMALHDKLDQFRLGHFEKLIIDLQDRVGSVRPRGPLNNETTFNRLEPFHDPA